MTKKLTETSAGGRGERDIGSDAYADYTKNITPGQSAGTVPPANPSITSVDAKKADKKQKEDNAQKHRQATVVDDEFHPRVPMPVHEFLGIPFSAKARLARQQRKGAKIKTRTDLATAKLSNIAARQKLKDTKAKLRDARTGASPVTAEYQPEAVTQAQLNKIRKHSAAAKGHLDMDDPSLPSRQSGNEMSAKQLAALHKLKQKVLGKDYDKTKGESVDRSPDKSGGKGVETPDEIQGVKITKLKPKLTGMPKARQAVVKARAARGEEVEIDETGGYVPQETKYKGNPDDLAIAGKRSKKKLPKLKPPTRAAIKRAGKELEKDDPVAAAKWGKSYHDEYVPQGTEIVDENIKLAPPTGPGAKAAKKLYAKKKLYSEKDSVVDAVKEVLGLGNRWPGMEKMPKTDPTKQTSRGTDAYVTGKTKIERLPKKKINAEVEIDEQLPVGHRSPSPGADSTGSYAKLQRAKERAKKAGVNYDKLPWGDQQQYDKEETEIDEKRKSPYHKMRRDEVVPRRSGGQTEILRGKRRAHNTERGVKKVRGAKEEVEMDEGSTKAGSYAKWAREGGHSTGIGDPRSRQRKHGGVSDPEEKGRDADSVYPDSVSVRAKSAGTAAHRRQRGVKKVRGAKEEVEMDSLIAQTVAELSKVAFSSSAKKINEKDWIKGAIQKPGALRKSLDVPAGENIPARKLASAAKEGGKMGQRARLAQTLKKMHSEFVPENGDHPPKKAHKHDKKKDKPEQGKVYALTGKSSDASIARGDSWRDSEVKK